MFLPHVFTVEKIAIIKIEHSLLEQLSLEKIGLKEFISKVRIFKHLVNEIKSC